MKKLFALFLAASVSLIAHARPVPSELVGKNITLVVPYGAGGNSDVTARQLAKTVEKITGLTIVVANKAGASGNIGALALAQAEPNGLTLGQLETGASMFNAITGMPNAVTRDQLMPVSASIESSLAVVVNADIPVNTVPEFMTWLRNQPKPNFSSTGSFQSMLTLSVLDAGKATNVQAINYKSMAECLRAVAAGETAFVMSSVGDAQALLDGKRVKVLAVGSRNRNPDLPQTPTLNEIYSGTLITNYNGIFAPKGTPAHLVEYFNWAWGQALVDAETRAILVRRDNVPLGGSVERARQIYDSYYDARTQLLKKYRYLATN
jgi:tripartite-type tricarboxylate transporter receptor subunit TctC